MALDNKVMYGLAGLAVIVVLIVVFLVMKKKEPYTVGKEGSGDNKLVLTSDANGNLGVTYGVPIGSIMLWRGSPETVPAGWGICDGSSYNGLTSPDLRNVFVLGAGGMNGNSSLNAVNWENTSPGYDNNGATGGASSYSFQITNDNLPAHTHGLPVGGCTGWSCPFGEPKPVVSTRNLDGSHDYGSYNGLTTGTNSGDVPNNPITVPTLPVYIALFYIMKYA